MANLLRPRSASHKSSYEGFDLSHYVNFTSSVGQVLPIGWDFLLPGDKITIKTGMKSIMLPMNSASPINLHEHVDYYFVPLQCLYSLFPSMLSDTNEDASSSLFDNSTFKDGFPVVDMEALKARQWALRTQLDDFGFENRIRGFLRIGEFLKYGAPLRAESSEVTDRQNILLWQAYQAIYQYFFRDDSRQVFDPLKFNVDKYYDTGTIPVDDAVKITQMYYRPWKKDPYTIMTPSPLGAVNSRNHFAAGDDNEDNMFRSFVKQWLTTDVEAFENNDPKSGLSIYPNIGDVTGAYIGQDPVSYPNQAGSDTVFANGTIEYDDRQSLQKHRIAQAIEKLSAIWMQSGKNYKDFMSNLFGVKGLKDDVTKPIYIGSDSNIIVINPEIANMTTGTGSVSDDTFESYTEAGEITGRGYGENNPHGVKFEAKQHGIVLALYSCVPDAVYGGDPTDMVNYYHKRNSFPNPVTDELGEQPLFAFELGNFQGISEDSRFSNIRGWLPRFHELKMKENRVYGAFKKSLSFWVPTNDLELYMNGTNWTAFYIKPTYINPIMLADYQTGLDDWSTDPDEKVDMFANDPLMHFFRFEWYKSSKMSSYGVPNTYFG